MAVHEPVLQGECATEAIEGTLVSGAVWHIVLRRPDRKSVV